MKQGAWYGRMKNRGSAEQYTLSDVAVFSRWYLNDYPVKVRAVDDGLFVLGAPRNSTWKYPHGNAVAEVHFWPAWLGWPWCAIFLSYLIVAVWMTGRWHKDGIWRVPNGSRCFSRYRRRFPWCLLCRKSGKQRRSFRKARQQQASSPQGEEMRLLIADLNLVSRLEYAASRANRASFHGGAHPRDGGGFSECRPGRKYPIEVEIGPSAAALKLRGEGRCWSVS